MTKMQEPPINYERGFLDKLDGRYAVAQIIRDQWEQMTNDLGGADQLSLAQAMLVERAIWLNHWLRQEEQKLAVGGEFDINKVSVATNSLQGVLAKLGLQRIARDVPSLQAYIANRERRKAS